MTSPLLTQAELTGMSGQESGLLGSALLLGLAFVPGSIHLVRDTFGESYVYWTLGPVDRIKAIYPTGMLDAFIKIADGDERDVLRFAERYGVLELCSHGLPASHNPPPPHSPLIQIADGDWCNPTQVEPVQRWQFFARRAKALLSIAAAFHQGREPASEDWDAAVTGHKPAAALVERFYRTGWASLPTEERQRLIYAFLVGEWLTMGEVRPSFGWHHSNGPFFRLHARTYGIIGVQIMTAVSRSGDVQFCDGCSKPYLRTGRMPQKGRRNYCDSCKGSVANKLRQRDWRAKLKEVSDG